MTPRQGARQGTGEELSWCNSAISQTSETINLPANCCDRSIQCQPRSQGYLQFQNGGRHFESGDGPGNEVYLMCVSILLWENGKEYLYFVKWARSSHLEHKIELVKKKRKRKFISLCREEV